MYVYGSFLKLKPILNESRERQNQESNVVELFSTRYLFFNCFSKILFYAENSDLKSLLSFDSWVCCGPRTSADRENVQPPVIKFACSFRAARVCLKIDDRLPHDGISSVWFTSKPASRIV